MIENEKKELIDIYKNIEGCRKKLLNIIINHDKDKEVKNNYETGGDKENGFKEK